MFDILSKTTYKILFDCRLQATSNLLPSLNIMSYGRDIVIRVAKARCQHYKLALEEFFTDCLTDARHAISAPKHAAGEKLNAE